MERDIDPNVISQWLDSRSRGDAFLRWAGGKRPFLSRYADRFPTLKGRYVEPFLGSAAVFFHYTRSERRPFQSILGDINLQLIRTYIELRDHPERVSESLSSLAREYFRSSDRARFYYDQRDIFNKMLPSVDAGRLIFINRTCWNGLYRVNIAGKYNVPHGMPKTEVTFPTAQELLDASAALQQAQLKAMSWRTLLNSVSEGDFVFLDPPYYSDLGQASKYVRVTFSREDHVALVKACGELQRRGIDFLLTNSADRDVIDEYERAGLDVEIVSVPRFINSKAELRVAAAEIIVRPQGRSDPIGSMPTAEL